MIGKSHYRVRAVNCGKCSKTHTWYKYRVWREGDKVKEEYMGKCDSRGNMEFDSSEDTHHHTSRNRYQSPPPNPPSYRQASPYEILGVSYYATSEQIKKAYRSLAKQYHPDVNKHADPRIIKEINVAYHMLMKR